MNELLRSTIYSLFTSCPSIKPGNGELVCSYSTTKAKTLVFVTDVFDRAKAREIVIARNEAKAKYAIVYCDYATYHIDSIDIIRLHTIGYPLKFDTEVVQ